LDEKMTGISLKKTTTSLGHYDNVPAQTPTPDPEPENGDKDYARFNFICDKRFVKKIRVIARIEGVSIRNTMGKTLSEWLDKYEGKNGP
jgi:hypothetical protein